MLANMSATLNWSELGVNELPTGTVTLLLADIEGSTRLWETRPDEMAAAIARLDHTLCDLVSIHNGVRPIDQGEGDSFVIAFNRAGDADGGKPPHSRLRRAGPDVACSARPRGGAERLTG